MAVPPENLIRSDFLVILKRVEVACVHGDGATIDIPDGPGERPTLTALILEMVALRHQIAVLEPSGTRRPCFSDNSKFETEAAIVKRSVTPVQLYDPLGRLIRVDHPNATFSLVSFDAWSHTTNDCDGFIRPSTKLAGEVFRRLLAASLFRTS